MIEKARLITDEEITTKFIPTVAKTWENTITVIEFSDRFNHLLYTSEVILKSIGLMLYGRLCQYHSDFAEIEKIMRDQFNQPTLGSWSHLVIACRKALINEGDIWAKKLGKCLQEKLTTASVINLCKTTRRLQGLPWQKTSTTVGELLNTIIELRNRTRHGTVRKGFFKEVNEDFHHTLVEVFTA
ncbi:hypothetical protein L0244_22755, partial [bacterium]|nr:hypothetical protein [bacterium]